MLSWNDKCKKRWIMLHWNQIERKQDFDNWIRIGLITTVFFLESNLVIYLTKEKFLMPSWNRNCRKRWKVLDWRNQLTLWSRNKDFSKCNYSFYDILAFLGILFMKSCFCHTLILLWNVLKCDRHFNILLNTNILMYYVLLNEH